MKSACKNREEYDIIYNDRDLIRKNNEQNRNCLTEVYGMTNRREQCRWLIRKLLEEMPQYQYPVFPYTEVRQKRLLRSLMNVRPPMPVSEEYLKIQDAYLQEVMAEKEITDAESLKPCPADSRLFLRQGDITALRCDAIVNAANSQLLGCFQPCHSCVDNMIHTMSGVQLRLACHEMMEKQGHEEPAGRAKITPGFNLPCRYVLHTVGPVVNGLLTDTHREQLAACYRSCLDLAKEKGLGSIAFCCISTGDSCFPNQEAAEIAIQTVRTWLEDNPKGIRRIIFNVFKDEDREIYERLLS